MENLLSNMAGLRELPEDVLHSEFPNLKDDCYLDHVGAALYSHSQVSSVSQDLISNLYSNPHSSSIISKHCTDTIDQVRYRILRHFNTDVDEYSVVFTSGATSSLKLVAETFNFNGNNNEKGSSGTFAYLQDNHTSVLGMREIVKQRGVNLRCVQHDEAFNLMKKNPSTHTHHVNGGVGGLSQLVNSLFVYPAQCNFSGFKYPLAWIDGCHNGLLDHDRYKYDLKNMENISPSVSERRWYCLIDGAAFVSTNPLDLSINKPDFVCLSFYKLLGFPTGLGALLIRNASSDVLQKCYYGGGTVLIALSSSNMFHVKRPLLHERFEDGTLNFLSIISLIHGLEALYRLGGGMDVVSGHCYVVARYCYERLLGLRHANSKPVIKLYCDTDFSDPNLQGSVVNFNILRHSGGYIGYAEVQALANLHRIHLRTGCFCNPGACQRHLKLTDYQLLHHFQDGGHVCGDNVDLVNGCPTGSIRVSFGIYSRLCDVDKLVSFIEDCFVLKKSAKNGVQQFSSSVQTKEEEVSCDYKREELIKSLNEKNNEVDYSIERFSVMDITINNGSCSDFGGDRIKLDQIFVYPIKSCAAMAIDCHEGWPIDARGFKFDRQWMVVSATGVALTQKTEPLLCLINPNISIACNSLMLSAGDKPDCLLSINDEFNCKRDVSLCQSKVCGDRVLAVDCGDDAASWLSDVLGKPGVRLVRQWVDDTRITRHHKKGVKSSSPSGQEVKEKSGGGDNERDQTLSPLSLSNQAQFLLINMSTVDWLADQLPPNSDCEREKLVYRFRSNFVISGPSLEPFAEKHWTKIEINGKLFKVVGPCNRCQMICIDQFTGKRTKEPLTSLAASLNGKLQFGIYLQQLSDATHTLMDSSSDLDCFVRIGDSVKCYKI